MVKRLGILYRPLRPNILLITAISLVVLVNAIFFLIQTQPGKMDSKKASNQLAEVQRQLGELTPNSDSIQVSDEEIRQLLHEAPISIELSDVLQGLVLKAEEAEVYITLFRQSTDPLHSFSTFEADPDSISRSQIGNSPTEGQLSSGTTSQVIFKPDQFEINAVGSLPQLINFFDRMASEDRVTVIETWGITEMLESEAEAIPELTDKKGNYRLIMNYNLYSIPAYQALFGEELHSDFSFDQVLEALRGKYPDIRSFQSPARLGDEDS